MYSPTWSGWLKRLFYQVAGRRDRGRLRKRQRHTFRPCLEYLEDRAVPSTVSLFSNDPQFVYLCNITTDGASGFYLRETTGLLRSKFSNLACRAGRRPIFAPAYNPLGITTDGTNIYWIDPNGDSGGATAIFAAPITGGPTTKIYSG